MADSDEKLPNSAAKAKAKAKLGPVLLDTDMMEPPTASDDDGIHMAGSSSGSGKEVDVGPIGAATSRSRTEVIEGVQVRVRAAYNKHGRSHAEPWIVQPCPIHGHTCTKSRSVMIDRDVLGEHAVDCYLGCWLEAALDPDVEDHAGHEPSLGDMEKYGRKRGFIS